MVLSASKRRPTEGMGFESTAVRESNIRGQPVVDRRQIRTVAGAIKSSKPNTKAAFQNRRFNGDGNVIALPVSRGKQKGSGQHPGQAPSGSSASVNVKQHGSGYPGSHIVNIKGSGKFPGDALRKSLHARSRAPPKGVHARVGSRPKKRKAVKNARGAGPKGLVKAIKKRRAIRGKAQASATLAFGEEGRRRAAAIAAEKLLPMLMAQVKRRARAA